MRETGSIWGNRKCMGRQEVEGERQKCNRKSMQGDRNCRRETESA